MATVELTPTTVAAGGETVARDDDGRVVFVHGALPGERVMVDIVEERATFARGATVAVVEASPWRRQPPCPNVARGCGGCGWQHVAPEAQRDHRRAVVIDALRRIGGVEAPSVGAGVALPAERYRTTVRCAVVDGRAGYRRRRSHDVLVVDDCLVSHPLVAELVADGRFGEATEVTLRAGARTGERVAVIHPSAAGVQVPDGTLVVGTDELRKGRRAWYHEEVAGRRWRISASSFFQARPDGAEALVAEVTTAVERLSPGAATLVDLCSGVGLFGGTVGKGRRVTAVERHRPAVADARHNLAGMDVRHVRAAFETWRPAPADVVVADPARGGLGRAGVAAVTATGASLVVLVSCDAAALGRDAGLLRAGGYGFEGATLVDLFPYTAHVEVVSRFVREGRA